MGKEVRAILRPFSIAFTLGALFHCGCSTRCESFCEKLYNEDECYIVVEGYGEEECLRDCEEYFERWEGDLLDPFVETMDCVDDLSCEEIRGGACSY